MSARPRRYRKKPLAAFEHGTRIYAPTSGERRYRVVATEAAGGRPVLQEELALEDGGDQSEPVLAATPAVVRGKGVCPVPRLSHAVEPGLERRVPLGNELLEEPFERSVR